MKILPLGAEFLANDGRTDKSDEANSSFSQILQTLLQHKQKYSFLDMDIISFLPFAQYVSRITRIFLTFWRRNYISFNFNTPCILNVNNTGTKYVRIMKQTAFEEKKPESVYHV